MSSWNRNIAIRFPWYSIRHNNKSSRAWNKWLLFFQWCLLNNILYILLVRGGWGICCGYHGSFPAVSPQKVGSGDFCSGGVFRLIPRRPLHVYTCEYGIPKLCYKQPWNYIFPIQVYNSPCKQTVLELYWMIFSHQRCFLNKNIHKLSVSCFREECISSYFLITTLRPASSSSLPSSKSSESPGSTVSQISLKFHDAFLSSK